MRQPKDPEDYAAHVNLADGGGGIWRVYCVECEGWKSIKLTAMTVTAFGFLGIIRGEIDIDLNTALLRCRTCNNLIEYLLEGDERRERIVKRLTERI